VRVRPALPLVVLFALSVTALVSAQTVSGAHSDLQGYWNNATMTPLERPTEFGEKSRFSPEEAAEWERNYFDRTRRRMTPEGRQLQIDLNDTWLEVGKVDRLRTSLIVDPPDGRLPRFLPAAQTRLAARPRQSYDGPETLLLTERCLLGNRGSGNSTLSPPIIPSGVVSPCYEIVQTDDYVTIFSEWMHDARLIRINGTHLPPTVKLWLGDSIGHWEGATLVVDTTNFRADTHNQESGERLHVVERFLRTDPETIQYRVAVEDPETWATPWTAEIPFKATTAKLFEFACHEANYSMELSLRGARAEEQRAKSGSPK
jgi:hypothetical protein